MSDQGAGLDQPHQNGDYYYNDYYYYYYYYSNISQIKMVRKKKQGVWREIEKDYNNNNNKKL